MDIPKGTIIPPAGRPSWGGGDGLPLIYLGWGRRDFATAPLGMHFDLGTNYFVLLEGEIVVVTVSGSRTVHGPAALIFDTHAAFGISQLVSGTVDVLVWIWQGQPSLPDLRSEIGDFVVLELRQASIPALVVLHDRCRNEVALADDQLPRTLIALRNLLDVEIHRGHQAGPAQDEMRWKLALAWMTGNLAIHAPVPALCDYLRMSPSTLHRFFWTRTGSSPGKYFRRMKLDEAVRLINIEGWQVKAVAFHLGYRHANDLSRAMRSTVSEH